MQRKGAACGLLTVGAVAGVAEEWRCQQSVADRGAVAAACYRGEGLCCHSWTYCRWCLGALQWPILLIPF